MMADTIENTQGIYYTFPRRDNNMRKLETPEEIEASRVKRNQRNQNWKRENYEQLSMRFKPGTKEKLSVIAESHGYSLRGLLVALADGEVELK